MKLKLVSLSAMLLICSLSFSQGLNFGIKGGASINKIDGRSFKDEFTYGYHVGGFVTIGLGKKFAIQPEVLFNQFKTDTSSTFSSIYPSFNKVKNIKLNYLSIPILLNYNVANILTLQAGPQFGILIDQSKTLMQNGQEAFKKGDFSLVGGAQIHIAKIRLQGRYFVGLNNISDVGDQNKWNNQGFQLSLGLAL